MACPKVSITTSPLFSLAKQIGMTRLEVADQRVSKRSISPEAFRKQNDDDTSNPFPLRTARRTRCPDKVTVLGQASCLWLVLFHFKGTLFDVKALIAAGDLMDGRAHAQHVSVCQDPIGSE